MDNTCLVERVGNSHVGYVYCLVENHSRLLTFKRFYHTLYCKKAWDSDDVGNPEEAEESGGDKAGAGNGSESDKAGNESDVTIEVESEPVLKAKGKHKASESVGVTKGHKDGIKCTKTTTGKPASKAVAVKTPAKGKTPSKSPSKSPSKKR